MTLIAGVDIGNATTEVALAEVPAGAAPRFLATATIPTTGIKGTPRTPRGSSKGSPSPSRGPAASSASST